MQAIIHPPKFLYGIIGHPLSHSLSPALHTWAMAKTGHAGAFCAWPVATERLAEFVRAARELPIHGLCVTIPHKTAVLPMLDGLTDAAQAVGAANTLFWRAGKLWGHNTDVTGFLAGLDNFRANHGTPQSALILGAGGAAHAVLHALQSLGVAEISLAARNAQAGAALAARFGGKFVPWEMRASHHAQLVINTTPLGMTGSSGTGETPLSSADFKILRGDFAPTACLAYDLVYNPLRTPFLEAAATAGWNVQEGLTMLAAQGLAQFELWSGKPAPNLAGAVEVLNSALAAASV